VIELAEMDQPQIVVLKTPRKKRILKELDAFISQWRSWGKEVAQITDHPYDRMTQSSIYPDGGGEQENIRRHNILQERTLAFLKENIVGHGFIYGQHGENVDRTDLRLQIRVKHRLNDLDVLRARIDYAEVPKQLNTVRQVSSNVGNKLLGIVPDFLVKYPRSWI
jgi:hypothetical protein